MSTLLSIHNPPRICFVLSREHSQSRLCRPLRSGRIHKILAPNDMGHITSATPIASDNPRSRKLETALAE